MHIKSLKKCSADHVQLLTTWHHEQWSYLSPDFSFERRLERMQRFMGDEFIPSTWVALDNTSMPLGSAAIVEQDMDAHPELSPWLASVYVSKQSRRMGIGSQLVQHVMQEAQKNGVEKLYLWTPDQSAFYQRIGWELLENCEYRGLTVSVMVFDCAATKA